MQPGCANAQFWSEEGILYLSQIYISDLKQGEQGQEGVGLEGAKVSVHRSETMFNIT
jgi:hypothetical protein